MAEIFAYGTLLDPANVKAIVGKTFPMKDAVLHGFEKIVDGHEYPIIRKNSGYMVLGKVLMGIDDHSLKLLDEYEGPDYRRIQVIVSCRDKDITVFTYITSPKALEDF